LDFGFGGYAKIPKIEKRAIIIGIGIFTGGEVPPVFVNAIPRVPKNSTVLLPPTLVGGSALA